MEIPLGLTLAEVEKKYILASLAKNGQNRTRTAEELGISLRGLRIKISKYNQELATSLPAAEPA